MEEVGFLMHALISIPIKVKQMEELCSVSTVSVQAFKAMRIEEERIRRLIP